MPSWVIEADSLSKRFGSQLAVDDVSFAVPEGSVYGFLGPNGAGKTTTIRMLLGLVIPDSGRVALLGSRGRRGMMEALPRVGSFVEGPGYVPYLSARENLERFLSAEGVRKRDRGKQIAAALTAVGLEAVVDKPVSKYSLGMRQRLGLAQAFLSERDLYILDEPTNGLDPSGMREVRRMISELAEDGKTVFLSTHLLSEAEQLCTHVAFMSQGRLIKGGEVAELRSEYPETLRVAGRPLEKLAERLGVEFSPNLESLAVTIGRSEADNLLSTLVEEGFEIVEFAWIAASLEDMFIKEVGAGFDVR